MGWIEGVSIHGQARTLGGIGGHGRTPQGGSRGGGGVKIDSRKTSFLSVSWRNFFLKFQGGSPRVKKDSVNLTCNAFFHINFSSRYTMVPGGS